MSCGTYGDGGGAVAARARRGRRGRGAGGCEGGDALAGGGVHQASVKASVALGFAQTTLAVGAPSVGSACCTAGLP